MIVSHTHGYKITEQDNKLLPPRQNTAIFNNMPIPNSDM